MKLVPLGDICHIRIGRTPSRANPDYWSGPIPWATIADLGEGPLTVTRDWITDLAVREARMPVVPPGTLLYSFKLTIGKMAITGTSLYTNEAIAALVPRDPSNLDRDYLRYALASIDGGADSSMAVKGRTLNSETLAKLSIPIIPVDDQRHIASNLTSQLEAVHKTRDLTRARLETSTRVREKVVDGAFDPLSGDRHQPLGKTGSLVDGDWILNADYSPSGVRLFQVGDVGRRRLLAKSNRHISLDRAQELKCTFLRPGDVLISRMPDPIGRACQIPDLEYPAITAVDVTIFRPDASKVATEFVVQFMNSQSWHRAAAAQASGATRARISRRNLEGLEIPLPALDVQRRIGADLHERHKAMDAVDAALTEELKALDALPDALLRHAFREVAV